MSIFSMTAKSQSCWEFLTSHSLSPNSNMGDSPNYLCIMLMTLGSLAIHSAYNNPLHQVFQEVLDHAWMLFGRLASLLQRPRSCSMRHLNSLMLFGRLASFQQEKGSSFATRHFNPFNAVWRCTCLFFFYKKNRTFIIDTIDFNKFG